LIAFCSPIEEGISPYTGIFVLSHLAVRNLMGCRIYRHTKLQLRRNDIAFGTISPLAFHAPPVVETVGVEHGRSEENNLDGPEITEIK